MEFLTNELTEAQCRVILEALPDARRKTYIELAFQHKAEKASNLAVPIIAAHLYVWNGYLAAVVDRTTGEVEVLLRNFIDESFADWNSADPRNGSRSWILEPEGELAKIVNPRRGNFLKDKANLTKNCEFPRHDDYVAGLTFGNWVHLLPKSHADKNNPRFILWEEALRPNLYSLNRVEFQRRTFFLKEMRNRATHRRPLVKCMDNLMKVHQYSVEVAKAINPELGNWLKREAWIRNALRDWPLKKDSPS